MAGVDAEDVVVEAEEDVGAGKASSISALEIAFNKVLHGIKKYCNHAVQIQSSTEARCSQTTLSCQTCTIPFESQEHTIAWQSKRIIEHIERGPLHFPFSSTFLFNSTVYSTTRFHFF